MKRHMRLIRKILEHLEARESLGPAPVPMVPGFSDEEVSYHVALCHQAGYVSTCAGSPVLKLSHLTMAGHDALDELRANPPD